MSPVLLCTRGGDTVLSPIPLYATTRVAVEVQRHLEEVAERLERPLADVTRTWNEIVLPRIRFVPFDGTETDDERVEAVRRLHAADAPTAALAVLLGQSVLLTYNHKHFAPLGVASTDVQRVSLGARELGRILEQANAATILPCALGLGASEATKRLARSLGTEAMLLLAFLAIGAVALYWTSERGRNHRAGAKQLVRELGPPLAEAVDRGQIAAMETWDITVDPPDPLPALALVGRQLAVANTLTTREVSDILRSYGYGFDSRRAHVSETRTWLVGTKAFYEVRRGEWSLGYHIAPQAP